MSDILTIQKKGIRIEKKEHITTIIITRPEVKNAINPLTAKELADAFREFEQDENAYVGILCGEGGTFCSGYDLKEFSQTSSNSVPPFSNVGESDGPMGPSRMILTKPTIAAISGYAVAGGLELALLCDLRVMEEDSIVGVFCRRWGVPLIDGGTIRLPRLIGLSRAMDLILTGRGVPASEALSMGLANRVVKVGESRAEAEKLAALIASFPQTCMKGDRISAIQQFDLPFLKALQNEFEHGMKSILKGESLKGATKFTKGSGRHGSFSEFQKSKL